jgi:hypothetical protein
VNFSEFDYSKKRIKEIEKEFCDLYSEKKDFDDCALDDVIMAPSCLIRITGIEDNKLNYLLQSGYNAACYCYGILRNLTDQDQSGDAPGTETQAHILQTIDSSLALEGYKVMDGDRNSVIIRHSPSDSDYEIKVTELVV